MEDSDMDDSDMEDSDMDDSDMDDSDMEDSDMEDSDMKECLDMETFTEVAHLLSGARVGGRPGALEEDRPTGSVHFDNGANWTEIEDHADGEATLVTCQSLQRANLDPEDERF
ncbi:unnamed protein product [Durusdinium trenchii]|uniref:Uncharacterized protein n=1 Tax=Durusdinium trenchii TaxID=1381693 RepID=A0ABP0KGX2_9DINO